MSAKLLTTLGNKFEAESILFASEITGIKEVRHPGPCRIKIRIREGQFPQAFVKTESGISEHCLVNFGTHWELTVAGKINHVTSLP